MIYLRWILIVIWLSLCCIAGFAFCLVRWGNPSNGHWFAKLFSWGAIRLASLHIEYDGLENLESHRPCIYVANHQSGLDMATFGSIYPKNTVAIGKKELLWIPFFGILFFASGNIMINRQKRVRAIAGLAQAVDAVRRTGVSVWIFPEGTRNRTEELLQPFKKGAFYMAIQAGVPIVPIVSSPLKNVVSWKERQFRGGRVRIRILPPVETSGLGDADVESLMRDVREKMIEAIRGLSA
jgi:1-acyl-sn-glycerol-3-phosphate acyltransferase